MWERIVLNLLSNAFKYTFQGEVSVELSGVENCAQLVVKDTGIGIQPKELPRIFERFHRVEDARGRTHEGTGIGLALVQELVKLHADGYQRFQAGLTEEQQKLFRAMLGKQFDIAALLAAID